MAVPPPPLRGPPPRAGEEPPTFAQSATGLAGLATVLFHWPPDTFWQSTPAELAAVFSALTPDASSPATTDTLTTLMEQFPDE